MQCFLYYSRARCFLCVLLHLRGSIASSKEIIKSRLNPVTAHRSGATHFHAFGAGLSRLELYGRKRPNIMSFCIDWVSGWNKSKASSSTIIGMVQQLRLIYSAVRSNPSRSDKIMHQTSGPCVCRPAAMNSTYRASAVHFPAIANWRMHRVSRKSIIIEIASSEHPLPGGVR